jgi:hypothetical protein
VQGPLDLLERCGQLQEDPRVDPVSILGLDVSRHDRKPLDAFESRLIEWQRNEAMGDQHPLRSLVAVEQRSDRLGLDRGHGDARLLADGQQERTKLGITDHHPH